MSHGHAERIAANLRGLRFRYYDERSLQDGLEAALRVLEYDANREVILSAEDRPDFMIDGVVIEVKIKGPTAAVVRQLTRYARHPDVEAIILVTSRTRHQPPVAINDKPVLLVSLALSGL